MRVCAIGCSCGGGKKLCGAGVWVCVLVCSGILVFASVGVCICAIDCGCVRPVVCDFERRACECVGLAVFVQSIL